MLRSFRLFRLFLTEQQDPDGFYLALAKDAAAQLAGFIAIGGRTVLDIGGGAGYVTKVLRSLGANCYLLEVDSAEMMSRGDTPPGAVLADGYWLPVSDGGADVCVSSNVLEHVRDPHGLIEEMIRATKPGGLIYLSFTNWYSPWGGHEMSPWHYLGAGRAERRYVRKHGKLPKNRVGTSLFRVHVGQVLRMVRDRTDVEVISARPRYYPAWCRALLYVPVVRELATWNLLLILRRTG
jgi:SAM-dependent methyltransferase